MHSCGMDRATFTYDLKTERRTVTHQSRGGGFMSMAQRVDSEQELVTVGSVNFDSVVGDKAATLEKLEAADEEDAAAGGWIGGGETAAAGAHAVDHLQPLTLRPVHVHAFLQLHIYTCAWLHMRHGHHCRNSYWTSHEHSCLSW